MKSAGRLSRADRARRPFASAAACASLALLVSLGLPRAAAADERPFRTDTPLATVETLHEGLVAAAAGAGADLQARYEQLRPLIDATHDLPYIAQVVLRGPWRELTAAQRADVVDAFERLSITTYASRFGSLTPETLRIVDSAQASSERAAVSAMIVRADADDIPLEYVLHKDGEGWRIVNIVADGVSDLALKRAEYQRVLADGTIERLVRYIEEQTARLASAR